MEQVVRSDCLCSKVLHTTEPLIVQEGANGWSEESATQEPRRLFRHGDQKVTAREDELRGKVGAPIELLRSLLSKAPSLQEVAGGHQNEIARVFEA